MHTIVVAALIVVSPAWFSCVDSRSTRLLPCGRASPREAYLKNQPQLIAYVDRLPVGTGVAVIRE
jgi:hypothetical protein